MHTCTFPHSLECRYIFTISTSFVLTINGLRACHGRPQSEKHASSTESPFAPVSPFRCHNITLAQLKTQKQAVSSPQSTSNLIYLLCIFSIEKFSNRNAHKSAADLRLNNAFFYFGVQSNKCNLPPPCVSRPLPIPELRLDH